jgi:hypothetical protein
MRRPDQVHERIVRRQPPGIRFRIEGVSDDRLGSFRHTRGRLRPRKHPHTVTACNQHGRQPLADITCAACDENRPTRHFCTPPALVNFHFSTFPLFHFEVRLAS